MGNYNMARYINEERTLIEHNGMFIQAHPSNRHYRELRKDGVVIKPYVPEQPAPQAVDKVTKVLRLLQRKGLITQQDIDEF